MEKLHLQFNDLENISLTYNVIALNESPTISQCSTLQNIEGSFNDGRIVKEFSANVTNTKDLTLLNIKACSEIFNETPKRRPDSHGRFFNDEFSNHITCSLLIV